MAQFVAFIVDVVDPVDKVGRIEEADRHVAEGSLLYNMMFYMVFADDEIGESEGGQVHKLCLGNFAHIQFSHVFYAVEEVLRPHGVAHRGEKS